MGGEDRTSYTTRLAERGLAIKTFDGHTLTLTYVSAADSQFQQGRAVTGDELTSYARNVLADIPQANLMFPGLARIEVEFPPI